MKRFITASLIILSTCSISYAQDQNEVINQIRTEISEIKSKQASIRNDISKNKNDIIKISAGQKQTNSKIDTINAAIHKLQETLESAQSALKNDIIATNESVKVSEENLNLQIKNKTVWGILVLVILAIVGAIVSFLLRKRMKSNVDAIENIKGIQDKLQDAQKKLEEESVKLDSKLVDIFDKQIATSSQSMKPDHSLVLKIADEIVRIEMNLSRMDSSVKGYKQLSKGVERIKDNFKAKGYEITDMLGKPYNEGMRINADFVLDENLEPGTRTITSITKPQIIFNGELIQKAIVTVTQNI